MTSQISGRFANFDAAEFLRDYWQKKPLLIRNPWSDWSNPVEPDELAGLACEPHVESRLITQDVDAYELEHGPLPQDRFGRIGKAPWTLLVQAVDHHIHEVADLMEPFRFIPNWRLDDVMVSYAVTGGGVGAHFDQYDVFLVQGLGTRRWQLGGMCDGDTALLPHDDLRLIADFEPTEEWELQAGDILYVPPRLAHNGVATSDDCMTYSIGFRAPSRAELVEDFAQSVADDLQDDDRYDDPDLTEQTNPGEIMPAALSRLHAMVTEQLNDPHKFAGWFAKYATQPKNPEIDWQPEEPLSADEIARELAGGCDILRNPASRFAFVRQDDAVLLSVDGESFGCNSESAAFAESLCASAQPTIDEEQRTSPAVVTIVERLHALGSIALMDPEGG